MGKERRGGPWRVDGLAEFLIREPHAQCPKPIRRCVISVLDRPAEPPPPLLSINLHGEGD
jgi:hypothetical protein